MYHERITQVLNSIEDADVQTHLTKDFRDRIKDIETKLMYWAPEISARKYGLTIYKSFVDALRHYQRKTGKDDVPEQYRKNLMSAVEDR